MIADLIEARDWTAASKEFCEMVNAQRAESLLTSMLRQAYFQGRLALAEENAKAA